MMKKKKTVIEKVVRRIRSHLEEKKKSRKDESEMGSNVTFVWVWRDEAPWKLILAAR